VAPGVSPESCFTLSLQSPPIRINEMNRSLSDRTIMQVSLRSLLLITSAIALLSLAVAPWVRGLELDARSRLAVYLILCTIVAAVSLVSLCGSRWRTERQSGKLLVRVRTRRRWWKHLGAIAMFAALLSFGEQRLSTGFQADGWKAWLVLLLFPAIFVQSIVSYVVVTWWWRLDSKTIEARELGLVVGGTRFVPWRDVNRHRLILHIRKKFERFRIDPDDKEELDKILIRNESR